MLHATQAGINIADGLLSEIVILGEYLGRRDINEDNLIWWNKVAQDISSELNKC
jgi:hypothetical protein